MPDRYTGFKSHATATSTGTSNSQTFTPPANAKGFYVTVATNGCYMTFDGTAPSSTNGLAIPSGVAPLFFPFVPAASSGIVVRSQAAANSVVNVVWVQ